MSYDLMVFRKESAPKTSIDDFLGWYEEQIEWSEDHNYESPEVTTENLKKWFLEMIETFPAMNGPYGVDLDDESNGVDEDYVADYSIGKEMIYVSFAWSKAEEAYVKAVALAEKHSVGFFDVSSEDGEVLIGSESGKLEAIV